MYLRDVEQLRRIRQRLEQAGPIGFMSSEDWDRISNQIAAIVINVLDLTEHPFTLAVTELAQLMQQEFEQRRAEWQQSSGERPVDGVAADTVPEPPEPYLQMLFLPKPGAMDELSQKFWPVQLLLLIAAGAQTREQLALKLGFDQQSIVAACRKARECEVGDWSPPQSLQNVLHALKGLQTDESTELILRGRTLLKGSTSVHLTPNERQYLKQLIEAGQSGVSGEKFAALGIHNLTKLRSRLRIKLAKHNFHITIRPGPLKGHVLHDHIRLTPASG